MSNTQPRRTHGLFAPRAKKERRPAGISRRRKKQFSFEALESRQVMSASAIVQPFNLFTPPAPETTTGTTSTAGGGAAQQDALARELWWYQQMAAANGGNLSLGIASPPNDPLFQNQWHLLNTGQNVGGQDFQPIYGIPGEDINVVPAWNLGYTGKGVSVAVIDSGVQLNHPDLAANIDLSRSFDAITPSGGNGNPFFLDPLTAHGTAVAGLIGAVANNGIGGVGVAPGVTLVPIRLIDFGATEQSVVDAFRHTIFNDIDITNNSWAPTFVRGVAGPSPEEFLAFRDSVLFGREGKGVIHVFASGNDAGAQFNEGFIDLGGWDSSAYNGYVNSRYVIAVTGVDHDGSFNNVDGTITAYPEVSSAVLVAAPTGSNAGPVITNDTGLGSGLWTTDLTGRFGYNVAPDELGHETQDPFYPFDRDFLSNPDYTSRMNGTSGAAPLVSGVIALMLEANSELTWRDVQEILVRSARMTDPIDVPTTGQGQGTGFGTQSTWIVNQIPIFHDPDFFFPGIPTSPDLQTLNPILDPNFTVNINGVSQSFHGDHHAPAPHMMTNGAGYTVSQGVGPHGEMTGFGHGVIDAELAVKLAEQWHTKNQALAPELSFTSFVESAGNGTDFALPAAQQGNQASGFQIVPGGIGGMGPFIAWWNEYYAAVPNFAALPPLYRGDSAIEFNVPANQTMSVENVEVKISISGDSASALDHLRVLLISPDGTHSELNHFWTETPPTTPFTDQRQLPTLTRAIPGYGTPGSIDTQESETNSNLVWTFRSTRHWGERTNDAIVFDPITGEPVIDSVGGFHTGIIDPNSGEITPIPNKAMTQGWRVVIENWDFNASLGLSGIEMAWHGRPIDAATQRISGAIGVDENRDDFFNYSRMISQTVDIDNDPTINRLGEIYSIPDVNQEDFAENVTVVARRVSDNQVVARFVTGHDGNFYFDLVPDEYIISIEDPEGRTAQEDTVSPAGVLQDYKTEWHITPDWFKVWDKVTGQPTETIVDANGTPQAWLDDNGDEQVYGMRGINFLLDPGEQPLDQVTFSGTVYADTNGDGAFNAVDTVLPNVTVYVDANQNGALDSGEVSVQTDASGQYTIVQPGVNAPANVNVAIVLPAQWTNVNPSSGLHPQFVLPGEVYGGFNFFIDPPANNAGGGGADQPGILLGSVFEDLNSDGVRNGLETGFEGITVWLDANNNGTREMDEVSTTTNQFGGYVFTGVAPGQQVIRIEISSPLVQTAPFAGQPWIVTLVGSSTISGLEFGFNDLAVNDFGDLPNSYEMRPDGNGGFVFDPAHHKKGKYWLGGNVDGELGNAPTPNADGDDLLETDDENGVVFDPIVAGATVRLIVTANTYSGYLQGWVDWNDDGDFLDDGERIVTDTLLVAGQNFVFYNVPDDVNVDNVRARFRFGEHSTDPTTGAKRNINSPWGRAATGEVEDYRVPVAVKGGPIVVSIPGDFDEDEDVDGRDFLAWQRNLGKTSGATRGQGDADADGDVDADDLGDWSDNFGQTGSAAPVGLPAVAPAAGFSLATAGSGNAFDRSRLSSVAAWSVSTEMSSEVATTVESHALSARPALVRVAGRLAELADRLQSADGERLDRAAEKVSLAAAKFADRIDGFQLQSLRRDRAFDELFGAGSEVSELEELAADLVETSDSDAAFAELANRLGWRRR